MTGIADDNDAAIALVISEYCRLMAVNPADPLLRYVANVMPDSFQYSPDHATRLEFLARFAPKGEKTPAAVFLGAYFIALRDSADECSRIVRRSSVSLPPIEEVIDEEEFDEDKFLF